MGGWGEVGQVKRLGEVEGPKVVCIHELALRSLWFTLEIFLESRISNLLVDF